MDAWIVADEAARLSEDIIAALRPMRARRPQARLRDAVNGVEPHRSFLDRLDERRSPTSDPVKGDGDTPILRCFPGRVSWSRNARQRANTPSRPEYLGIPVSGAAPVDSHGSFMCASPTCAGR